MRKHSEAKCEVCPLQEKPCAKTQGPTDAKIAFVARSPGYHEAMTGKPFSGPSGKILDHLLRMNGVSRNEILSTNVVLCAPDAGKVPPEAIKACAPRLQYEIKDCSLVIAAGSEAVNLLVGRGAIDRYRGYRIARNGQTFVATNNPALVLRDDSTFPNLIKDFKRAFHPIDQPPFPEVEVIEDERLARDYINTLIRNPEHIISTDLETRGGTSHKATIVSMQFALEGRRATVLGERGGLWENHHFIDSCIRPLFSSNRSRFVWHNGKFDTKILRHSYGIPARVDEDTMLLSYACDERGGIHGLEYLLAEEYGWPDYEPESVKKFKKTGVVENYDELHRYAGWDAAGTFQLFGDLLARCKSEGTYGAYRQLLIPGSETLRTLELNGIQYNVEAAANLYELEVGPELEKIDAELQEEVDNPLFNPRSPQQVASLYYDKWRIRHELQKRPDMARSVDDSARTEILEGRFTFPERDRAKYDTTMANAANEKFDHIQQVVRKIDRAAKLQKLAGTYILGLIEEAQHDPNGKIHTNFYLHNTTTGRLSSREPNLQNIARTREGLPDIRALFYAPDGAQIVSADYSQAELRCIAYFSGDPELNRVYKDGLDLHAITAARFFGENFTSEQRSISKNCNFGMFYRQSAETFQEKHGIKQAVAQKYIDWSHEAFPTVWKWEEEIEKQVHNNTVTNPFGRRRRFYLLTQENKQACYREAINFYPQSTASDFTLLSLIKLVNEIDPDRARICLTVHDSILASVDDDYIDSYSIICRQIMESRPRDELSWDIPFAVDIGIGKTWSDAK